MLFNSIEFIFFFLIVTTIYFILPFKFRWIWLLAASCYFYMVFKPIYILILGFTIVVDYFAGISIENAEGPKRKMFLTASIVANIGVLAIFKYYNFLNFNIGFLLNHFGYRNHIPYLSILLPIGLSFHTFQAMSYTIEVYRGNQKAEKHFGIYALYVMFYPQLVAGPIERPQNILHQFYQKHTFDYTRVTNGLKLMLWGFFLKIVVADNMALLVNHVYEKNSPIAGAGVLAGIFAFAFQIYCDFAGYTNIALGAAAVMGYQLMSNFDAPFLSKNITEFWRRWHISLSTWFNDYLFSPLVFNLRDWGKAGVVLALLITFFLSGLWHGAGWTFVIFGVLHGIAVCYDYITQKRRKRIAKKTSPFIYNNVSMLLTFLFACFTWVFFRATDISQAVMIFKRLGTHWTVNQLREVTAVWGRTITLPKLIMAFAVLLVMFAQYYHRYKGGLGTLINRQPIIIRWGIYLGAVLSIFLFGVFENIHFIYFQF